MEQIKISKYYTDDEKMTIPEGPGWSPDGGEFFVKGEYLYWNDGTRWDMTGGVIRLLSQDLVSHNNDYSKIYQGADK